MFLQIKIKLVGKRLDLVSETNIVKEIENFCPMWAILSTDIPLRIIKKNANTFGSSLCELFHNCINNDIFPNKLKRVNIMPVFKTG